MNRKILIRSVPIRQSPNQNFSQRKYIKLKTGGIKWRLKNQQQQKEKCMNFSTWKENLITEETIYSPQLSRNRTTI